MPKRQPHPVTSFSLVIRARKRGLAQLGKTRRDDLVHIRLLKEWTSLPVASASQTAAWRLPAFSLQHISLSSLMTIAIILIRFSDNFCCNSSGKMS